MKKFAKSRKTHAKKPYKRSQRTFKSKTKYLRKYDVLRRFKSDRSLQSSKKKSFLRRRTTHPRLRPEPFAVRMISELVKPEVRRVRSKDGKVKKRLGYKFVNPKLIDVCRRRRDRRRALFARAGAGKGIRVSSKRKYTEDSKVRCS